MTVPPPLDVWVLEAATDLVATPYARTKEIVSAWTHQHLLASDPAFKLQYSGRSRGGPFEAFSVTGTATPDQVEELTMRLQHAFHVPVTARRAQLIAVPHVDRTGLEKRRKPTSTYAYVDPVLEARIQEHHASVGGGLDAS